MKTCCLVVVAFLGLLAPGLDASLAAGSCQVMINEINVNGPGHPDTKEFIELRTDCSTQTDLDGYSLVGWNGPKSGKTAQAPTVELVIPLNGMNFKNGNPYLVIAADQLASELENITSGAAKPAIYRFSQLRGQGNAYMTKLNKNGVKIHQEYFNNGIGRGIAICLYRNPVGAFILHQSHPTALVDQLVDVVIYHQSGSGESLIRMLVPKYALPGVVKVGEGIILTDHAGDTVVFDTSLSYCCQEVRPQWPLAFKTTSMSPGAPNDCKLTDKFALTKVGSLLTAESQRCDFKKVQELLTQWKDQQAAAQGPETIKKPNGLTHDDTEMQADAPGPAALVQHFLTSASSSLNEALDVPQQATVDVVKSTERQVTVLASTVGTLVVVVSLVGIVSGYLWMRQKKSSRHTAVQRMYRPVGKRGGVHNESARHVKSELESEEETVFSRMSADIH